MHADGSATRYTRVAVRCWSGLTAAGDDHAGWQAVCGHRCRLRLTPSWGWIGALPSTTASGLLAPTLVVARRVWPAIAGEPRPPALAVCTSKGDIAQLALAASSPVGGGVGMPASAPGMLAPALAAALGTGPYIPASAVAACASGLYAILEAADWIERGGCRTGLVVAADRSLTPLVLAGFDALGVTCGGTAPDADGRGGIGFAPAEGIAAVALAEDGSWRLQAGVRAGDAGHATRFQDPEALRQVLGELWRHAPTPDLILVHGTGTAVGEAYESAALNCGPWSQTARLRCKPWIGHALGASALVELGIAWHAPVARLWQLSLGFGGHLATAAWQRSP
jgi:hypothetical protein